MPQKVKAINPRFAHIKDGKLVMPQEKLSEKNRRTVTEDDILIGRRIKYYRLKRGLKLKDGMTISRLSRETGIPFVMLWRYEQGCRCSPERLAQIAMALRVKIGALTRVHHMKSYKSLDMLVLDVNGLSNFLGGIKNPEVLKWAHDNLITINNYCKSQREGEWIAKAKMPI